MISRSRSASLGAGRQSPTRPAGRARCRAKQRLGLLTVESEEEQFLFARGEPLRVLAELFESLGRLFGGLDAVPE